MRNHRHEDLPDGWLKRMEQWIIKHRTSLLSIAFVVMFAASIISGILALHASSDAKNAGMETKQLALENRRLLLKFEAESRDRRDQACLGLESSHLQEIRQLRQTYDIFKNPPPELKQYITTDPRAIEQLRQIEKDARDDEDGFGAFVPAYCDDPGFGRPEPDPKLPKKPAGVP